MQQHEEIKCIKCRGKGWVPISRKWHDMLKAIGTGATLPEICATTKLKAAVAVMRLTRMRLAGVIGRKGKHKHYVYIVKTNSLKNGGGKNV